MIITDPLPPRWQRSWLAAEWSGSVGREEAVSIVLIDFQIRDMAPATERNLKRGEKTSITNKAPVINRSPPAPDH